MKNKNWYVINDLEKFVDASRAIVFNSFGQQNDSWNEVGFESVAENDKEEFNSILSHEESMLIAKEMLRKQTHKTTLSIRYLVSDNIYYKFINCLNERMVGNLLNNLVNKGLVETAFDDKTNDFIFWVSNDQKQNPETD